MWVSLSPEVVWCAMTFARTSRAWAYRGFDLWMRYA